MKAPQTAATAIRGAQKIDEGVDYLAAYCEGWSKGDADMIRSAVADDYVWDDPEEGRVSKDGLGTFLPEFVETIDSLRDDCPSMSYLILSDFITNRVQVTTTVWCCFAVPGTSVEGISQIRLGDNGVISEHRAYRTRPNA